VLPGLIKVMKQEFSGLGIDRHFPLLVRHVRIWNRSLPVYIMVRSTSALLIPFLALH
jgi:hypothetical protein